MSRQVRWDAEPVQPSAAVRRRRLVHPSPRPWRYAGRALEHAVQMALIGKAATEGDRGERHVGRDEQLLGGFDPLHLQPAMRRQTSDALKARAKCDTDKPHSAATAASGVSLARSAAIRSQARRCCRGVRPPLRCPGVANG
jgi:hypothetical protein